LNTLLAGHRGPWCRAGAAPVEPVSGLVAILFTDVVSSAELLARVGDGNAHRILQAHHDLLAETAARHRGEEVKWLGDGLMVVFGLLGGRPEFRFSAAHVIHVGGLCPVTAHEVGYQLPGPQASAERLFADVMVELCR